MDYVYFGYTIRITPAWHNSNQFYWQAWNGLVGVGDIIAHGFEPTEFQCRQKAELAVKGHQSIKARYQAASPVWTLEEILHSAGLRG